MFGGIGFMLGGNLAVGVLGPDLIVRVGPKDHDAMVKLPKARPFDYTGRPMKGWLYVAGKGITKPALERWMDRGITFARSLPKK
jgi:hypothetical protein